MRPTMIAGAFLSLFLLVFNPAHATSVSFSSDDSGDGVASPSLILSPTGAMSTGGVGDLASPASVGGLVGAPFDSSLVAGAPDGAGASSIGVGNGQFARGPFSVQCEVPPSATPASVVPEPPTVVLLALGLAVLYWARSLRGEVSNQWG